MMRDELPITIVCFFFPVECMKCACGPIGDYRACVTNSAKRVEFKRHFGFFLGGFLNGTRMSV